MPEPGGRRATRARRRSSAVVCERRAWRRRSSLMCARRGRGRGRPRSRRTRGDRVQHGGLALSRRRAPTATTSTRRARRARRASAARRRSTTRRRACVAPRRVPTADAAVIIAPRRSRPDAAGRAAAACDVVAEVASQPAISGQLLRGERLVVLRDRALVSRAAARPHDAEAAPARHFAGNSIGTCCRSPSLKILRPQVAGRRRRPSAGASASGNRRRAAWIRGAPLARRGARRRVPATSFDGGRRGRARARREYPARHGFFASAEMREEALVADRATRVQRANSGQHAILPPQRRHPACSSPTRARRGTARARPRRARARPAASPARRRPRRRACSSCASGAGAPRLRVCGRHRAAPSRARREPRRRRRTAARGAASTERRARSPWAMRRVGGGDFSARARMRLRIAPRCLGGARSRSGRATAREDRLRDRSARRTAMRRGRGARAARSPHRARRAARGALPSPSRPGAPTACRRRSDARRARSRRDGARRRRPAAAPRPAARARRAARAPSGGGRRCASCAGQPRAAAEYRPADALRRRGAGSLARRRKVVAQP